MQIKFFPDLPEFELLKLTAAAIARTLLGLTASLASFSLAASEISVSSI
jgi:hypothetical protein